MLAAQLQVSESDQAFPEQWEVAFPAEYLEHSVRDLLRLSQTNVTSDPERALQFGAAAFQLSMRDEMLAKDPTAPIEAAGKVALQAELAGRQIGMAEAWLRRGLAAAVGTDVKTVREEAGNIYLLGGRLLTYRMASYQTVGMPAKTEWVELAADCFELSELKLQSQHEHNGPTWDRYGTMLSRHWAAFEVLMGNYTHAQQLAAQGIRRAILAKREGQPPRVHARFVAKQVGANLLVRQTAAQARREMFTKTELAERVLAIVG